MPYPKGSRRLPTILTQEEAIRLIDSAGNLFHRAMLMTLYSTGVRRTEAANLKVADIDSKRMVVHIRQGKGRREAVDDAPAGTRFHIMLSDVGTSEWAAVDLNAARPDPVD